MEKLSKDLISFEELEFNPVKEKIPYKTKDGEIKEIIVYNPDEEMEIELKNIILKNIDFETKKVKLDGSFMNNALRLLTNINFPKDNAKMDKIIEGRSSLELKKAIAVVFEMMVDTAEVVFRMIKSLNKFCDMSDISEDKLVDMLFKNNEVSILEKQLEKEQLEKNKEDKKVSKPKPKKKSSKKKEENISQNTSPQDIPIVESKE